MAPLKHDCEPEVLIDLQKTAKAEAIHLLPIRIVDERDAT
jgi:hypothetical protein